jgi:hypothetical protein
MTAELANYDGKDLLYEYVDALHVVFRSAYSSWAEIQFTAFSSLTLPVLGAFPLSTKEMSGNHFSVLGRPFTTA